MDNSNINADEGETYCTLYDGIVIPQLHHSYHDQNGLIVSGNLVLVSCSLRVFFFFFDLLLISLRCDQFFRDGDILHPCIACPFLLPNYKPVIE